MQKFKIILTGLSICFIIRAQNSTQLQDRVAGRLIVYHHAASGPSAQARLRAHGLHVERRLGGLNVSVVTVPAGFEESAAQALRNDPTVSKVEYDYYAHPAATPNDPQFGSEWHLSKIQAPAAWDTTTGSSIPIAVVDSGVDGSHPDLAPRLMGGWNFVAGNSNTSDVTGHGTAVAGTIAAAANNAQGVAGVTWNNPIMPLLVLDSSGNASYSNIAAAIEYAVDHGARVINISLGGSASSSLLQSAVDYAWNAGAVVVAASMNNSSSTPEYPAACNHAIAVSATDESDSLASFSDYGSWITLAAPGNNILTTNQGGGYGFWYGTSLATPVVSGVAALALAANPSLGAQGLVTVLEQSADDLGPAGFDSSFGWGRVNAYRAVMAARGQTVSAPTPAPAPAPAPAPTPTPTTSSSGSVFVNTGGAGYTDSQGTAWSADPGFSGKGGSWSPGAVYIANTNNPTLYQSEAYGDILYQFSVPNGSYTVTLKFAELEVNSPGQRLFNVYLNGTPVLQNFDVVATAGGPHVAVDRQFSVNVANGVLQIQLGGVRYGAEINGIQISPGGPAPAVSSGGGILVNAGGPGYTDPQGTTWSAGLSFSGKGGSWSPGPVPIANTNNPELYQSEAYGDILYQFSLPNGSHMVTLKFAELEVSSPGQRLFNVYLNGQQVLQNFDVVAASGRAFTAIDKQFTVNVTNGLVQIQLQGVRWGAYVNGIQIQ